MRNGARWWPLVWCLRLNPMTDVPSELQALLANQLARYKQPKHWFFLPQLPKTALGKVQKAPLKTQLMQQLKDAA
jgi:acyl-coenzyme A synthetase/AMP-(fatty) acid ligase